MTMSKKTTTPSTPSSNPSPAPVALAPPTAPVAPPPTDPNAALAAVALQAVAQLDAIEASLGSDPPLSPSQKRHAGRMHRGGPQILAIIATLAVQHDLVPPALQIAPMTAEAGKASALQPLANRLAALTKLVGDLIFTAQSSAWEDAMQFYSILQRQASTDTSLAAALQPVTQFFARRPKSPQPAGTPTKPQKKATKKAVATLAKNAPELLAPTPSPAASPAEAPATPPAAATPPKS
ncbi:MAG TPA: hypothetical protein VGL81_06360 [Polyangiaceae bacterium]